MTESVNLVNANVHQALLVHSVKLKSVQLLAQVRKMEFVKMANVVVFEVIRAMIVQLWNMTNVISMEF